MKRLTKMRFFDIAVEYSRREITFEEVKSAFNEFADDLVVLSNAEPEHSTLYRILTYARTRLQTLPGRIIPNEAKKNVLIKYYINDAIGILDAELELLNLRIKYPEEFQMPIVENWKSPVYHC